MAARIMRCVALLLPLLLARTALAEQDGPPWDRAGTFVVDSAAQDVDTLTQSCPPPQPGLCAYDYPVLGGTCEVEEARELGGFGDARYLVIRYLRETTFDEGPVYGPFKCGSDEIVLAALSGGGKARILWRDATERTFVFISSAKLVVTPSGESVLSVLYCLNGTGGCAQGMLVWHVGAWRKLERDDSWRTVYRNLPAGYRPHKSPEIDLANLTWEQNLARRDDANCCPSGRIEFKLAIVDGKLSVKSYRIVTPDLLSTEPAIGRLMTVDAAPRDGTLPEGPFGEWLNGLLPGGTTRLFAISACGAVVSAPGASPPDPLQPCFEVDVKIPSRARTLRLLFDRESIQYRGGDLSSPGADYVISVPSLAALPRLLVKGMRMRPIACPEETVLKLKENFAGLSEWCEDGQGRRQGPYRSWFSTGIYLMNQGQYRNDAKTGEWIECSRFENCEIRKYEKGQVH